ncbi:MAG: SDR family oxidoreductase [Proteobacteria bacterium]|nr:SDR family oxidoreductase [Pseudomonadota bacterium]
MKQVDLTGKVAIVTGSSRGIGREIALALAQAGCDVCVAAKTTEPHPRLPGTIFETRDAILKLGRKAIAVKTNLREEAEIANMVEQTVTKLGRVDILINNAGALWWKNVEDTPLKKFDLVVDVNARAAYGCAYYCLPHMKKQGYGHIINMSPPLEVGMTPGKVAYCVSKFGMTILAHGLSQEVRKHGIAVNALWPATMVESQAAINFGLGGPKNWRKSSIISDATLAILSHEPPSLTGHALLDEEILTKVGVSDFEPYRCEPGGTLIRIAGKSSVAARFGTGAGGSQKAKESK